MPRTLPTTLVLLCVACGAAETRTSDVLDDRAATAPDPEPEPAPPSLLEPVHAVARGYLDFGRVDDMNRWSPELCMIRPGRGRVSGADEGSPHGRKLYYLYARDRDAYFPGVADPAPVGQAVVKEAFEPRLVDPAPDPGLIGWGERPPARHGGHVYEPGEPHGLFVMLKLDPATPGTDEGWVYATVDVRGHVLRAGRLDDCMACHDGAGTTDRLFGVVADER